MLAEWLLAVSVAVAAPPCGAQLLPDSCETMDPSHGGVSQTSKMPFEFYLNKETVFSSKAVHFAIKARAPRETFSGFMVQVRDDQTGIPVGQFDVGCADIKVMTCYGVFANTAIHLDSEPKKEAHMRWLPDLDFSGNVTFFATVAQSRQYFWARQPTRKLTVVLDAAAAAAAP